MFVVISGKDAMLPGHFQLRDLPMPPKYPWHSALDSDVYHVCSNCTLGNNIEDENLRHGEGNRKLCDQCSDLITIGAC